MATIPLMATEKAGKMYVRTTARLKSVLGRVLSNVRGTESLAERSRSLSQETFVNATWLMLADMDPESLAESLKPYIARVEETLAPITRLRGPKGAPDRGAPREVPARLISMPKGVKPKATPKGG